MTNLRRTHAFKLAGDDAPAVAAVTPIATTNSEVHLPAALLVAFPYLPRLHLSSVTLSSEPLRQRIIHCWIVALDHESLGRLANFYLRNTYWRIGSVGRPTDCGYNHREGAGEGAANTTE